MGHIERQLGFGLDCITLLGYPEFYIIHFYSHEYPSDFNCHPDSCILTMTSSCTKSQTHVQRNRPGCLLHNQRFPPRNKVAHPRHLSRVKAVGGHAEDVIHDALLHLSA